jgi:hypothetical protein
MSLASRKVSADRADLGIRQLLVSPGLLRLPRLGQFRRVAFTNPFTDRGAELGLLNLPRPPRSCRPLAGDAVSRLAKRPRGGPGLDVVALVKIMRGEEDAPPAWKVLGGVSMTWPAVGQYPSGMPVSDRDSPLITVQSGTLQAR